MAASSRKTTSKQLTTTLRSADNEELTELVKSAVAEAVKESIPALVEDVVAQLTAKMQAVLDAQLTVFRLELNSMQTDISKCTDSVEKVEGRMTEVEGRLSRLSDKLSTQHARLEDKIADMEDRSRRDNIRVHGVPENAESVHALAYLVKAFPQWFPELGPVEIMRAHRIGAPREDSNGKPVPRTLILKLLRFTDRDNILKAARRTPVTVEGRTIRFTPDYSPHTFKRRLAFSDAMDNLQKMDYRTFLLYPAKLKATRGGTTHIFNTPKEAKDFTDSLTE